MALNDANMNIFFSSILHRTIYGCIVCLCVIVVLERTREIYPWNDVLCFNAHVYVLCAKLCESFSYGLMSSKTETHIKMPFLFCFAKGTINSFCFWFDSKS